MNAKEPGPKPGLSHSQWFRRVLLEELATRRDVELRELAREAGLGVDDRRDPLDVGLLGDLLLVVDDRLQRLLVGVEVGTARLLRGGQDALVEVTNALGGLVYSVLLLGGGGHVGSLRCRFFCRAASSLASISANS